MLPFLHLRLVAHAQRAAGHFHARAGLAEHRVVAFLVEDHGVHLGRRRDPQAGRDVALAVEDLAGGAEVADVGHARADEDFVDLVAGDFGEQLDVVRIVRAGEERFLDVGQVDLDHGGVFGVGVRRAAVRALAIQSSMALMRRPRVRLSS